MKNNKINYGCLWVIIAIIAFWLLTAAIAFADAYDEPVIPDIHRASEPTYQHKAPYWQELATDNCIDGKIKNAGDINCTVTPKKVPEPLPLLLIGISTLLLWAKRKLTDGKNAIEFLFLFRQLLWGRALLWIAYIFVASTLAWALVGCGSVGTVTRFSDGTVSETHAITFGSTAAVTDFKDSIGPTGRRISFGAGKTDVNVEALQQSNDILGKVVEGFTSGTIKGIK